jgi:hypothetical protein
VREIIVFFQGFRKVLVEDNRPGIVWQIVIGHKVGVILPCACTDTFQKMFEVKVKA